MVRMRALGKLADRARNRDRDVDGSTVSLWSLKLNES